MSGLVAVERSGVLSRLAGGWVTGRVSQTTHKMSFWITKLIAGRGFIMAVVATDECFFEAVHRRQRTSRFLLSDGLCYRQE